MRLKWPFKRREKSEYTVLDDDYMRECRLKWREKDGHSEPRWNAGRDIFEAVYKILQEYVDDCKTPGRFHCVHEELEELDKVMYEGKKLYTASFASDEAIDLWLFRVMYWRGHLWD